MKNRLTCLVITILALLAWSSNLSAQRQQQPVDLGSFTKEIMVMDFRDGQDGLAMWLPYEFFVVAVMNEGKKTQVEAERDLEFLKPYITMVVQSSVDKPDGTSVYSTEKEIRARSVLKLADGTELIPLEKIPPMVSATIAAMKAILDSEGGEGQSNLHLVVFSGLTKTGAKVVDASQKSQLTLVIKGSGNLKEKSFTWRTPFDALASVSECPRCKAGASAKWTYCPFCGQKLPHD